MADNPIVEHFEPAPRSAGDVRRLVQRALTEWGLLALTDRACLCASELATNAVLHSREPFDVSIRRFPAGVHIDVVDRRPSAVPSIVPASGSAADITAEGTTGRGLQIVAAFATRWGFSTSAEDKSVWFEITPERWTEPTAPIVVLAHREEVRDSVAIQLLSVPVRASVAEGVQVDELVRELQFAPTALGSERLEELYRLLDASAPVRVGARHAALRAAGLNLERFDLNLRVSIETLVAMRDLNTFLSRLRPSGAQTDLRSWIESEVGHQLGGGPPRACPLT